jgi:hypothetical protein
MTRESGSDTELSWCPACQSASVLPAGRKCAWCGAKLWHGPRGHWPGGSSLIGPAQARVLHRAHAQGMSLRAIARAVWQRLGYRSEGSCLEGIRAAFRREGLPVRRHSVATAAANRARGNRLPGEDKNAYRRRIRRERSEVAT